MSQYRCHILTDVTNGIDKHAQIEMPELSRLRVAAKVLEEPDPLP